MRPHVRVADGGGQTDAPWIDVRHAGEPLNQTEGLPSTVATDEGVDLVDDNEAQVMEQLRNRRMLAQQQRLQRFGVIWRMPEGCFSIFALWDWDTSPCQCQTGMSASSHSSFSRWNWSLMRAFSGPM